MPLVEQETVAPPPPGAGYRLADRALRVAGGIVSAAGGVLAAVLGLVLAPVRVDGHLVGVSVPVTIAAAIVLSWFAYVTVGRTWALALPALPWFALMAMGAVRTAEGDLLLTGDNWVGLAMITAGAMTFAVMAFRRIVSSPQRGHHG
ncbi:MULTISPECIES: hypothetical protein [unclassified Micromonospora]|uniref:hypothetical protein n=1 Tax=unclassified Micromonospora TaxID=2617518 RepID=UPI001047D054|nr:MULTISPECIES: hypothetical protein [unclassified Micromonospora]TDB78234.1 hypothetical protein E1182_16015 [Micromonospora sp. KC721]TDC40523.1 hypothetical protein E1166_14675 [Micromonospora sp. KC213]